MLKHFFEPLLNWYLGALDTGGYLLIGLLMAVESSIVPLPSEFVIPPAAHLAHTTGRFSMWGIVLAGALGSWLGASAMYWASRWAGRPLALRYGKYFFISAEKIEAAERWSEGGIVNGDDAAVASGLVMTQDDLFVPHLSDGIKETHRN